MSELDTALNQLAPDGEFIGSNNDGLGTAGAALRSARESAGLHIAALAAALKVPVKKLEALEADQYDLLPDAVFTRALASSVCRTLKIDASTVLDRLPQKNGSQLRQAGSGINAPFRGSTDGVRPSAFKQVSRSAVLAGIALLLGALILIFLPVLKASLQTAKTNLTQIIAPATSTPDPILTEKAGFFPSPQASSPNESAGALLSAVPVASAGSSASASVSVSATNVDTSTELGTAALTAAGAGTLAPATDIVVFTAKNTSWVEVSDATRQVILRRTLNPGESVGTTGVLPLSVIVGRADATDVQVRGKSFDLSNFSKNNVARFEVK